MKKALICLLSICISLSLFSCKQDDETDTNNNESSKSKYSSTTERKTEPTTQPTKNRTASEAYELAKEQVPNAILASKFFSGATSYKITDYEYKELHDRPFDPYDYYDFDIYGIALFEDHYGNVNKKKEFHVSVTVPLDESKSAYGFAYN